MYGLDPANIERFTHLRGGEVEQICVGKFDLQFHLHPKGNISVWAMCELRDARGNLADVWEEQQRSPRFCAFIDLLGAVVSDVSIENATALRLHFVDGRQLVLLDVSQQHESFQVDDVIV
jgi:hypothetical protein